jgi:hypothetical protein
MFFLLALLQSLDEGCDARFVDSATAECIGKVMSLTYILELAAEFNTAVMLVLLMEPCSFISVDAGMVQVQTVVTIWEGWGVGGISLVDSLLRASTFILLEQAL